VETVSNIGLSIELTLQPEKQKMQPKVRKKDKKRRFFERKKERK
jgi:hypothetical protein